MHEVSIVQSIVEIISEKALENNIKKVNMVKLKIGELSGVNEDSIRFAFEIITKDTFMEYSTLEIYKIEGKGFCKNCNISFKISHLDKRCPKCKEVTTDILGGYELMIESFDGD